MSEERKEILMAALDEFADHGILDSSLESIAARANVPPGSVRALFVDERTLLRELLEAATDTLISGIALAVEQIEDPKQLLRKSLRIYDQWLLDHPKIVRLIVRCCLDGAESLHALYEHSLLPSEFNERLMELIQKKQVRCNNIFVLNLLLDSLILFPHMMRSALELMNPRQSAEEMIEGRFDLICEMFENGLYVGEDRS